jgi:hypothetical protein
VRKLIDGLAAKRAGYQRVYAQLSRDPCASELRAYRLAGPLELIVCGVHLDRGYRLAFTMQPPEAVGQPTRVVILYVGLREPSHRLATSGRSCTTSSASRTRRSTTTDPPAAREAFRRSSRTTSTSSYAISNG